MSPFHSKIFNFFAFSDWETAQKESHMQSPSKALHVIDKPTLLAGASGFLIVCSFTAERKLHAS
jgi:hypothetical protein